MLSELQIYDSDIKEIPENAFHYSGGVNEHLERITFESDPSNKGMITTVRKNAFTQLKSMYFNILRNNIRFSFRYKFFISVKQQHISHRIARIRVHTSIGYTPIYQFGGQYWAQRK